MTINPRHWIQWLVQFGNKPYNQDITGLSGRTLHNWICIYAGSRGSENITNSYQCIYISSWHKISWNWVHFDMGSFTVRSTIYTLLYSSLLFSRSWPSKNVKNSKFDSQNNFWYLWTLAIKLSYFVSRIKV